MDSKTALLICDLESEGHHAEYVSHLIAHRKRHPESPRLTLFIHPGMRSRLAELQGDDDFDRFGITMLHPSPEESVALGCQRSELGRGRIGLKLLKVAVHQKRFAGIILMRINHFQVELGFSRAAQLGCPVSGILFRQFTRIDRGKAGASFARRVGVLRRWAQLRWMLRSGCIRHVFLLNDPASARLLNRVYRRRDTFVTLPDPVPDLPEAEVDPATCGTPDDPAKHRTRFLVFGALTARKSVYQILQALSLIGPEIGGRLHIRFVGQVVAKESERFPEALRRTQLCCPTIRIEYQRGFIPYSQVRSQFAWSDCVLVPYVDSHASSGVLGHAAREGKPVIGPSSGLVGSLIRQYDLGACVSSVEASSIAHALCRFIQGRPAGVPTAGMARFVAERTPEHFARTVLGMTTNA